MKIFDWIDDLMTRPTRKRRELIFASRQGASALAIVRMSVGKNSIYEVYNSAHASCEPVNHDTFDQALRYTFPQSVVRDCEDVQKQYEDARRAYTNS